MNKTKKARWKLGGFHFQSLPTTQPGLMSVIGATAAKKLPGHRLPHESQISDYCEDELGAGNRTLNPYIRSIYEHHKFCPMAILI